LLCVLQEVRNYITIKERIIYKWICNIGYLANRKHFPCFIETRVGVWENDKKKQWENEPAGRIFHVILSSAKLLQVFLSARQPRTQAIFSHTRWREAGHLPCFCTVIETCFSTNQRSRTIIKCYIIKCLRSMCYYY
jgi:hypothetical protein